MSTTGIERTSRKERRKERKASWVDTPYAKVPVITALFWIVKLLTTALGEATSDSFISVPYVMPVVLFAFIWGFRRQLRSTHYQAVPYWFTVAGIAIFGTFGSDVTLVLAAGGNTHPPLLPSMVVTLAYAGATAWTLRRWYQSEGTLDVHSITTRRRQRYYWWTVTFTFCMGTAAGDTTAGPMHLGLLGSIGLFGVAILIPWLLHNRGYINSIVAFWSAYVLTRPLGASIADWLDKPVHDTGHGGGGIDLGTLPVAGVAMLLFAGLVTYLAVKRPDVQEPLEGVEFADPALAPGQRQPEPGRAQA